MSSHIVEVPAWRRVLEDFSPIVGIRFRTYTIVNRPGRVRYYNRGLEPIQKSMPLLANDSIRSDINTSLSGLVYWLLEARALLDRLNEVNRSSADLQEEASDANGPISRK